MHSICSEFGREINLCNKITQKTSVILKGKIVILFFISLYHDSAIESNWCLLINVKCLTFCDIFSAIDYNFLFVETFSWNHVLVNSYSQSH